MKRGVTIWSEGLEALNLDPAKIEWKDDDSYTFEKPIPTTVSDSCEKSCLLAF